MSTQAAHERAGRNVAVTINSGVISTGDNATITVHMPTPAPEARWALRSAAPAFSGREADLDELLTLLDPEALSNGRPISAVAVTGMAGVGKTELAVKACHLALARGWFPGGVLFTDMYGYDDSRRIEPETVLEGFLRALGVASEHVPSSLQDRQRLYASVLAEFARDGQRVLVVIDNVADAHQARPLLPADQSNRVIVTSRHTLAGLGARRVELDVLDEASAVALLERSMQITLGEGDSRVRDDPASSAAIARQCGCLPLALVITAGLLADIPAKPLAAMADELIGEHGRLARLVLADDATDYAVRAGFDISYRRLSANQARMFRLLSVNPGPDIASESAAVLTECERAFR